MSDARASAFACLALANLFWAGNWVLGRALRDAVDPISLNFYRWVIAIVVLAPFALPGLAAKRDAIRRHIGILAFPSQTTKVASSPARSAARRASCLPTTAF